MLLLKLTPKILYVFSAHFINYLRIATLPSSTQTANTAMSTAPASKKIKYFINDTTVIKRFQSYRFLHPRL